MADLEERVAALAERLETLELVVEELLHSPRVVCEHGILFTLHCDACERADA